MVLTRVYSVAIYLCSTVVLQGNSPNTFEVAENQHQYTLDSSLQVSNENMKNVELDNIDY
jgi:hypothetical protein